MTTDFTITTCDYCPAPVIWGNTGKSRMPVNVLPDPGGNVVLLRKALGAPQVIVTSDARAYPGEPRRTSHFDDCPHADAVRKPRPRSAAPQVETLF